MPTPVGILLEPIKNKLDITWADPAGDEKLSGDIARGMRYLNSASGEELDYSIEDKPRELLIEYCRYARSGALNEFQTNYLHEILSLQISREVARYKQEQSADVQ